MNALFFHMDVPGPGIIIGSEFENTIRLNTEVIVVERGSQRGVRANPLIWLPDQIIKAKGQRASDIAFSGFIASAICRVTHLDGEIISLLERGDTRPFVVNCCVHLGDSGRVASACRYKRYRAIMRALNDYLHVDVNSQHL